MKLFLYNRVISLALVGAMLFAALGIIAPRLALANSLPLEWATTAGGSGSDEAKAVVTDAVGTVYTTGDFNGSGDFDNGAGTTTLTSAGQSDVFIAKYSSSGALTWAKSIGGTNFDNAMEIALDGSGNVYVVGYFLGTADFDPGAGTANLSAGSSYTPFVLKLDSSGSYVWAKTFIASGVGFGTGIGTDGSSNVYIGGSYSGTMDADPGAGTSNLTATGDRDIFVIKLDSSGALTWAKSIGGASFDHAMKLTTINTSSVFLTGVFTGTVDFDPDAGTSNLVSNGDRDAFILKLDNSGALTWAKSVGGTGSDDGRDIYVDTGGNVNVAGSFNGTADFDPGAGTSNATPVGSSDAYALKLTSAGSFTWVKTFGGSSADQANSIKVGTLGDVVVGGDFFGTIDLDPSSGEANFTAGGGVSDGFIVLLQSDGSYEWSTDIGGDNSDNVQDIATDEYFFTAVGKYFGTVDFDGTDEYEISTNGSSDGFVARYALAYDPTVAATTISLVGSNAVTFSSEITDTGGDTITSRGFQYSVDNSYSDSVSESGSYSAEIFALSADNLGCGTTYNVRSFAESSAGLSTGTPNTFTTSACPQSGSSSGRRSPVVPNTPSAIVPPIVNALPNVNLTNTPALIPAGMSFLRSLSQGARGEDVRLLQKFLNQNNFVVSDTGGGSPGQETSFFGPKTKAALIRFQEQYRSAILDPLGLTNGTGYFGQKTRDFINSVAK